MFWSILLYFLQALAFFMSGFGFGVVCSSWALDKQPHKPDCTCVDCDLYRYEGIPHE